MLLAMCMDALREGHLSQAIMQLKEGQVRVIVVPEKMDTMAPSGKAFVQRKDHTN